MNKGSIWCALICLLLIPIVTNAQPPLHKSPIDRRPPQEINEGEREDERSLRTITYVGYQDTIPSLLYAVYDENIVVATLAVTLLRRFPESKEVITTLSAAIADPREWMVIYAARSLHAMGKTEWLQDAVNRLPEMQDRLAQIQLSGLLAEAGMTDGWPFVIDSIIKGELIEGALEYIEYFNGKIGKDGHRIIVADELSSIVGKAPAAARPKIIEKINKLRSSTRK
jgi:hypothetical protein